MLILHIGTECGDYLHCDKCKQCKYKANYSLHNFSVNVHRFFQYKLHIKLPHLIYIGKRWERLSGTDKCPFNKSRNYTCYDCRYCSGALCRECSCEDRTNASFDNRKPDVETDGWGKRCAYFEKCDWADDYKTKKIQKK